MNQSYMMPDEWGYDHEGASVYEDTSGWYKRRLVITALENGTETNRDRIALVVTEKADEASFTFSSDEVEELVNALRRAAVEASAHKKDA